MRFCRVGFKYNSLPGYLNWLSVGRFEAGTDRLQWLSFVNRRNKNPCHKNEHEAGYYDDGFYDCFKNLHNTIN